jgi:hypothetical protein
MVVSPLKILPWPGNGICLPGEGFGVRRDFRFSTLSQKPIVIGEGSSESAWDWMLIGQHQCM